jgi:hypothetical protein
LAKAASLVFENPIASARSTELQIRRACNGGINSVATTPIDPVSAPFANQFESSIRRYPGVALGTNGYRTWFWHIKRISDWFLRD